MRRKGEWKQPGQTPGEGGGLMFTYLRREVSRTEPNRSPFLEGWEFGPVAGFNW